MLRKLAADFVFRFALCSVALLVLLAAPAMGREWSATHNPIEVVMALASVLHGVAVDVVGSVLG